MAHNVPNYGPWNSRSGLAEPSGPSVEVHPWSSTKQIWATEDSGSYDLGTYNHKRAGQKSTSWRAYEASSEFFRRPLGLLSSHPPEPIVHDASTTRSQQSPSKREHYLYPNESSLPPSAYPTPIGRSWSRETNSKHEGSADPDATSSDRYSHQRPSSQYDTQHNLGLGYPTLGAKGRRSYSQQYRHDCLSEVQGMYSPLGRMSEAQGEEYRRPGAANRKESHERQRLPSKNKNFDRIDRMKGPLTTNHAQLQHQGLEAGPYSTSETSLLNSDDKDIRQSNIRPQLSHNIHRYWRDVQTKGEADDYVPTGPSNRHWRNSLKPTGNVKDESAFGWNDCQRDHRRLPTPPSSERSDRTPRALPEDSTDIATLHYRSYFASQVPDPHLFEKTIHPLATHGQIATQALQQDRNDILISKENNCTSLDGFKHWGGNQLYREPWSGQIARPLLGPQTLAPLSKEPSSRSTARSRLLEDFKHNHKSGKTFELRDIYNHIVEFSGDQEGSRFIQNKMESANSEEKARIFEEILPNALPLMADVFGNYIIQKFFEIGEQNQKRLLAAKMKGQMVMLSLHVYGCRAVQKALQFILVEEQASLIKELEKNIPRCVKDQNGNHVMQAALEHVPPERMPFMIKPFLGQIKHFSLHVYGCRVVQRLLKYWSEPERSMALEEVHACSPTLITDQYGNYVIQYVLGFEKAIDRQRVINIVRRDLLNYSRQKFASNVVEKCLTYGDEALRQEVMMRLCEIDAKGQMPLTMMVRDAYGNYVIQKLLETLNDFNCRLFIEKLAPEVVNIKKLPGPTKPIEMVARKMQDRMPPPPPPPPALLPTPPSTADSSRSPSSIEGLTISE